MSIYSYLIQWVRNRTSINIYTHPGMPDKLATRVKVNIKLVYFDRSIRSTGVEPSIGIQHHVEHSSFCAEETWTGMLSSKRGEFMHRDKVPHLGGERRGEKEEEKEDKDGRGMGTGGRRGERFGKR